MLLSKSCSNVMDENSRANAVQIDPSQHLQEQSSDSLGPVHMSIFRPTQGQRGSRVKSINRPRLLRRARTELSSPLSRRQSFPDFDFDFDFNHDSHSPLSSLCNSGETLFIADKMRKQEIMISPDPEERSQISVHPRSRAYCIGRRTALVNTTALESSSRDYIVHDYTRETETPTLAAISGSNQIIVTCTEGVRISQDLVLSTFSCFGEISCYRRPVPCSNTFIIEYCTSDSVREAVGLDGQSVLGHFLYVRQHMHTHGNSAVRGKDEPAEDFERVSASRQTPSQQIDSSPSPVCRNGQTAEYLPEMLVSYMTPPAHESSVTSTPSFQHTTIPQAHRMSSHSVNMPASGLSYGMPRPVRVIDSYFDLQHSVASTTTTPIQDTASSIEHYFDISSPPSEEKLESRVGLPSLSKDLYNIDHKNYKSGLNFMGLPRTIYEGLPNYSLELPQSLSFEVSSIAPGTPCENQLLNKVEFGAIARSTDMRTTIMIKNIPNKINQEVLKRWIDATNEGTYDFLYLRIDFKNKCNVGYAFINFTDPIDIITFGQARVGTTWNIFASEKVCDVSYANLQGKAALVEKFRNSCVMDEREAYRPHIYHSSGPQKGQNEPFPGPNDLSRKARSTQAAQQIGLFPPQNSLEKCPLTAGFPQLRRANSLNKELTPKRQAPRQVPAMVRAISYADC